MADPTASVVRSLPDRCCGRHARHASPPNPRTWASVALSAGWGRHGCAPPRDLLLRGQEHLSERHHDPTPTDVHQTVQIRNELNHEHPQRFHPPPLDTSCHGNHRHVLHQWRRDSSDLAVQIALVEPQNLIDQSYPYVQNHQCCPIDQSRQSDSTLTSVRIRLCPLGGAGSRVGGHHSGATRTLCDLPSDESRRPRTHALRVQTQTKSDCSSVPSSRRCERSDIDDRGATFGADRPPSMGHTGGEGRR